MKHYETVTREVQYKISTTCDLCGGNCGSSENYYDDEVTIHRREGSCYPEGNCGTEVDVDLCGKCFAEKLIPWLKSQGANVVEREWDTY